MFAKAFLLSSVALLASAADFQVKVGGLDASGSPVLKFDPEFVNAAVGDQIHFTFMAKNHSITQTSFDKVCKPLLNDQAQPVFTVPFHPVAAGDTNFAVETYTVQDASKPLWFYCPQTAHCGKGMIFSINCPTTGTNTLDAFRQSALAFGAAQAAAASSASAWSATATATEVIGGSTYAPVYAPTVTATVTFESSTWTTTYQSYANSPDPTPVAAAGVVHEITVGANGLTFDPPSIQAAVRDTVRFKFLAKNHTVTQSTFAKPCLKQEFAIGTPGFDSGFIPGVADGSATFEITVNDTKPIWGYCRQTGHCGQGMVFAINADESSQKNFAAFQALAKTLNGTSASPSGSGSVSGSGAFLSASVLGGVAGVVLLGFGSVAALVL